MVLSADCTAAFDGAAVDWDGLAAMLAPAAPPTAEAKDFLDAPVDDSDDAEVEAVTVDAVTAAADDDG